MNLYDILLARCICSNKSEESVVATPLEVTENGEYEAEEGYAYNPVTVNVGGGDVKTLSITIIGDGSNFDISADIEGDGYTSMLITDTDRFTYYISVEDGSEQTVKVVYLGDSVILVPYTVVTNITGNATYDSNTGRITATGDFTVSGFSEEA